MANPIQGSILVIPAILVLLVFISVTHAQLAPQNNQWCYCSNCPYGLKYCSISNGVCYKKNVSGIFEYGCMTRLLSYIDCSGGINRQVDLNLLVRPTIQCCDNNQWCLAKKKLLSYHGLTRINAKYENQLRNRVRNITCYCNECGSSNSCITNIACFAYISVHGDTASDTFGCAPPDLAVTCPSNHSMTRTTRGLRCCNEGGWCNVDPTLIQDNTVDYIPTTDLATQYARLERGEIIGTEAAFYLKMFGTLSNRFSIDFRKTQESTYRTEQSVDNTFRFKAELNVPYEVAFSPTMHYVPVTRYEKVIYFMRLQGQNVTWLPDIHIHTDEVVDVICDTRTFDPDEVWRACRTYHELSTNPIWLIEP